MWNNRIMSSKADCVALKVTHSKSWTPMNPLTVQDPSKEELKRKESILTWLYLKLPDFSCASGGVLCFCVHKHKL